VFARTSAVSYLFSRDISRHSLNGLTFCHLSVQNYTGFATYAGSTKRPLFLKQCTCARLFAFAMGMMNGS
jgi:hypothetical protein